MTKFRQTTSPIVPLCEDFLDSTLDCLTLWAENIQNGAHTDTTGFLHITTNRPNIIEANEITYNNSTAKPLVKVSIKTIDLYIFII